MQVNLPREFISDGCTFPFEEIPVIGMLVTIIGWIMGRTMYKDYCREHDFLRRYAVVHWIRANLLLSIRILRHTPLGLIHAPVYFLLTTISYPFYRNALSIPDEWRRFAIYYQAQLNR